MTDLETYQRLVQRTKEWMDRALALGLDSDMGRSALTRADQTLTTLIVAVDSAAALGRFDG